MSRIGKGKLGDRVRHGAAVKTARKLEGYGTRFRRRGAYEPLYHAKARVHDDVPVIGGKVAVIECVQHYAPYDPATHRRTNADCTPDAAIAVKVGRRRVRQWISMRHLTVIDPPVPQPQQVTP